MFQDLTIIDLSVPLSHLALHEPLPASIRYVDHREGAEMMQSMLGVQAEDLVYSQGLGWALEEVSALDRPFSNISEDFQKTGDGRAIWPAHFAGIEKEYCQIEKLANLHLLPSHGFMVNCLPVKIEGASAGWCRAVALLGPA